jgi:acyl carrier protein
MNAAITAPATIIDVKSIVAVLGIDGDRAAAMHVRTVLLGSLPRLQSMPVVEFIYALKERFAIAIGGDRVRADGFETLGRLTELAGTKLLA